MCARLVAMIDETWNSLLREQFDLHWTEQLRPRLDGLTDDEYFWEPAPGCWSVRPGGEAEGPHAERPLAALVLHINRELILIHHLAEVNLLRDLHLHTRQETN
jgi:hypothetical protein